MQNHFARALRRQALRSAVSVTLEQLEGRRLFSTAYALFGSSGTVLTQFDTASPGTITDTTVVTGLQSGEQLRGIDFRPSTGQLYALGIKATGGDDEGRIYTINTQTGAATQVGSGPFSTSLSSSAPYGFDFNPAVDRIRVTNGDDQNLRINPFTGFLVQFDTPLDDPTNDEEVTGAAYDRNISDVKPIGTPQSPTTLFGIDFINDTLVRIGGVDGGAPEGSPNNGVVTEIGPLGITTASAANGFDIGQDGIAYAALTEQGSGLTSLYTIDLTTGEATAIGEINNGAEIVRGFAVAPDNAPPTANPDTYQVGAGGSLTVDAPGVLANDTDPEGDPLTAELISGTTTSQGGTVVLNPDGSFTYTPPAGFVGVDSFSYVAHDGTSDSTVATVTLNVVPLLSINDKAITEGNSGTKQLTFTVSLSAPAPAGGVTVKYKTNANTASSSSDYVGFSNTLLTFAPGETSKTVDVTIRGDTSKESDETFYVRLSEATGAVIDDNTGVGTIINDDSPPPAAKPKIRINNETITEGNSGTRTIVFTVTLDVASSKTVTVKYQTQNDTAGSGDYVAKSGTLTFAPGQKTKTISITIKGDTKYEGNERFKVNLFNAVNADIADGQGIGNINNDD